MKSQEGGVVGSPSDHLRPRPVPPVPPVVAIVIHRRRPWSCIRTVQALLEQGPALRVIVVDNSSSAADRSVLRSALPMAEIIELPDNRGFGPAANTALRLWLKDHLDASEWALLCPHDALPAPGCLAKLLEAVRNRSRVGLASAEYGEAGSLGKATHKVKPVIDPYLGGILVPSARREGWEDAGHPHGTFMVLRRECLQEIGLFDERYFAYCEEADLAERARRAGWEVGVVWGAVVRNGGMSSEDGVAEYLMVRNTLLLVRHHFGAWHAFVLLLITTWITVRGTLWRSRRTLYWHTRGRWLALHDYLLGRFGPPPAALLAE